jgi:hypothetical protein
MSVKWGVTFWLFSMFSLVASPILKATLMSGNSWLTKITGRQVMWCSMRSDVDTYLPHTTRTTFALLSTPLKNRVAKRYTIPPNHSTPAHHFSWFRKRWG